MWPSRTARRWGAAGIGARARASTRSAAAICSSNARASGSSAFSRTSQLASATSLSCNASNDSRSGCTLPPCMLDDFPGGTFGIALVGQCLLFHGQPRLFLFRREIDFLLLAREFAIEPSGLEPVHRALEQQIRLLTAQALGLQRFVRARRGLIEPVR